MNFLKKHWIFVIWLVLIILLIILKKPFWWGLVLTLLLLLCSLLIHLPNTLGWAGYFLKTTFHKEDASFSVLEKAHKKGMTSAAPRILYGMDLLKKSRFEEAKTEFEDVVTIPKLSPVLLKIARQDLGIAYYKCGDLDRALATYLVMAKDYDILSADFYTTLSYFYIMKNDLKKAEEVDQKALGQDESFAGAFDNMGQIRYQQGRLDEAMEYYQRAVQVKDDMPSSYYYMGLIAEKQGKTEDARQYFTAAHNAPLTGLNTVTRSQVDEKYQEYLNK